LTRHIISVNICYAEKLPHERAVRTGGSNFLLLKGETTIAANRKPLPAKSLDRTRVNQQIRENRAKQFRVVGEEGQLGIYDLKTALSIAEERDLDLVEISPDSDPPVLKIMDYGKFKFEKGKKLKEAKKKQATVTLKEIKMRPMIDTHDFDFKKKNAVKFIQEGDKVKVTVRFRGRELAKPELGEKVLLRFAEELKEVAKIESEAKMEGRQMVMILTSV